MFQKMIKRLAIWANFSSVIFSWPIGEANLVTWRQTLFWLAYSKRNGFKIQILAQELSDSKSKTRRRRFRLRIFSWKIQDFCAQQLLSSRSFCLRLDNPTTTFCLIEFFDCHQRRFQYSNPLNNLCRERHSKKVLHWWKISSNSSAVI